MTDNLEASPTGKLERRVKSAVLKAQVKCEECPLLDDCDESMYLLHSKQSNEPSTCDEQSVECSDGDVLLLKKECCPEVKEIARGIRFWMVVKYSCCNTDAPSPDPTPKPTKSPESTSKSTHSGTHKPAPYEPYTQSYPKTPSAPSGRSSSCGKESVDCSMYYGSVLKPNTRCCSDGQGKWEGMPLLDDCDEDTCCHAVEPSSDPPENQPSPQG
ncbi:hypothetical protein SARC_02954 [Sphaeroforma arctica JP610]|uniref:Uncharacterized protein n=1 Tax=Sphaeroforma arctica JP610 TaxID=667725 RepID=A0A0L0G9A2_9EUKA|nr:hypothetical protein SARC_02954 [Sphaeroforma arctica JP610]KNC84843.1 hypothetical protein SARC_02954 [Sphaeroforma arctica JP610]|eukprot:XP_014158745.1 hypothetical protein SARC_02954 [Sphaeroforma arctica JP610]